MDAKTNRKEGIHMIKVGDLVLIRPSHSIRFGGRWGKVKTIRKKNTLPLGIAFEDSTLYYFDYCEVMSEKDVFNWLTQSFTAVFTPINKKIYIRQKHIFPYVSTSVGLVNITQLKPVTTCRKCGEEMVGSYSVICDECNYPLPSKT